MRYVVLALAALLVVVAVAFAQDPDRSPPHRPEPTTTPNIPPPADTPVPTAPRRRSTRASRRTSPRSAGTTRSALGQPACKRPARGRHPAPELGEDFFTWDPVYNRIPNRDWRRWGTDRLIRTILTVIHEYRTEHDSAQRVGIMDLSRPHGGRFGRNYGGLGHASHQNGLDADILYPRKDGTEARADQALPGRPQARPGPRRPLRRGRRGEGLRRPAPEPQGTGERRRAADLPRRSPARANQLSDLVELRADGVLAAARSSRRRRCAADAARSPAPRATRACGSARRAPTAPANAAAPGLRRDDQDRAARDPSARPPAAARVSACPARMRVEPIAPVGLARVRDEPDRRQVDDALGQVAIQRRDLLGLGGDDEVARADLRRDRGRDRPHVALDRRRRRSSATRPRRRASARNVQRAPRETTDASASSTGPRTTAR